MCVFGDVLVSVSEPPVRLWPAGCWEHGEGGRALETSPLTAWMCGGGCHPAEQVSEISALTQGFPWFLPFYRTLSISVSLLELISLTLIRGRTLMGVIFLTAALLVTFSCASCFPVCSFISTTPCVSFFSFLSWQTYSSGLGANVCAWGYRLLRQGPAARRLCGARRGPGYHKPRSPWWSLHHPHVTFGHHVAAAGKQVTESNGFCR